MIILGFACVALCVVTLVQAIRIRNLRKLFGDASKNDTRDPITGRYTKAGE